jgi:uncharacterized membrane protein
MRGKSDSFRIIAFSAIVFLVLAPFLADTYNTLNQRAFLDLMYRGNPFSFAPSQILSFRGRSWLLDWPYPPITILLDLPAWILFNLTRSEQVYQFAFKLPLYVSAILTQWLILKILAERELAPANPPLAKWYVLLPCVVMVTSIAGGFDIVVALFILLAYYLITRGRFWASALALGLAGGLRLYPLLLVPVYVLYLYRSKHLPLFDLGVYFTFSLAPLLLSCAPFILNDSAGFFTTLKSQQSIFGPLATFDFISLIVYPFLTLTGYAFDFQTLGPPFLVLSIAALAWLYVYFMRDNTRSLAQQSLLALLVFFLFYPKMHGLYTIAFLPLAFVQPTKTASWIWVPGLVWMILANGDYGATGIFYWLAPATGMWITIVTPFQNIFVSAFFAGAQAYLIIKSIVESVR